MSRSQNFSPPPYSVHLCHCCSPAFFSKWQSVGSLHRMASPLFHSGSTFVQTSAAPSENGFLPQTNPAGQSRVDEHGMLYALTHLEL